MGMCIDFKRIQQLLTQDINAIQEYIFKCTPETAKSDKGNNFSTFWTTIEREANYSDNSVNLLVRMNKTSHLDHLDL